jgi:S1-C subfamily serine protease
MKSAELFDAYLNSELSGEEKAAFEQRLASDSVFNQAFAQHCELLEVLEKAEHRSQFKKRLKAMHEQTIGRHSKIIPLGEETFARKHGKTIAVAASTALFAVFSTVAVLSAGGYLLKKQSNQITELKRDVMKLQASNNGIVEGIIGRNKSVYAPANVEGSAFALNNEGYIVTSFHLINGADSIFIQNSVTERVLANLVFSDPKLDMAILKVVNDTVTKAWQVPFTLVDRKVEVGEKVFTLGYPRNEMVYGEGSLSSLSGLNNDSCMVQISIPVNPGNSGGPLLDEYGNIIGVIRGKVTTAEATGFAIKAKELIRAIQIQSEKSETKVSLKTGRTKNKAGKRTEQIKKINPYVFNVMVYKGE